MGNLDFSANADQLKELATYMASQINVPTIGIGGGYAPIGSINFFDATTAPQDWLACDGTVYNIADYPQLADYYESQHGSKNYFGGNGSTTFAVPDLRGEFLRGAGNNSHANQGNGGTVGVHQDGTVHIESLSDNVNTYITATGNFSAGHINSDYNYTSQNRYSRELTIKSTAYQQNLSETSKFTSRPTNTSFLICVKAVVAGEVYSTEERVVGTWIDGKPLYQKTLVFPNQNSASFSIATGITNIDIATIVPDGSFVDSHQDGELRQWLPYYQSATDWISARIDGTSLAVKKGNAGAWFVNNADLIFTIRYTKTTD